MAKKLTFTFAIIFALIAVGCSSQPSSAPATQEVTIDGQAFTLELALDGASRTKGLSGRDVIADDGGMLFVFPDRHVKVQRFVMRDCPNPIPGRFAPMQKAPEPPCCVPLSLRVYKTS